MSNKQTMILEKEKIALEKSKSEIKKQLNKLPIKKAPYSYENAVTSEKK